MTHGAPTPEPLSDSELAYLWRWERGIVRAWAMAVTVIALAVAVAQVFGDSREARVAVLGGGLAVLFIVALLQLRERCPRCGARLALQSLLVLPDCCRRCGVSFPRPPPLDSELDN